ncbi:HK97 gp10 family phage protein [Bosea robiniae]|uniref:HK97-gp10 family putative phage morphogenesis protein n=1 Tax=Bosea TaxID=85413 RepID=UPI00285D4845|nr:MULTISPECIES: HK97-gp10 family putative phage morphogenesis protein [Bosea]MDR6831339.1 HK97 gp10 family phage protein [Bosea robiniae]MDR6898093.1 HK97 gp10 family phage protein [Bosea sp. BE109]MDR7141476.1 HK97 gp10 family phage protein [Bosea sp. BE168]
MSSDLDRLNRRFDAVLKNVREVVQPALMQGANEIADMQRQLAVEDTGALRDSITVTPPGGTTPPYSQPGGSRVAKENEAIVTAGGTDVRYPHLVEHGTSQSPAQPFFWPGFRLTRTRAQNRIKRSIRKAVRTGWDAP